jgi:hypothetical protein
MTPDNPWGRVVGAFAVFGLIVVAFRLIEGPERR